jgi:hypothetical protein
MPAGKWPPTLPETDSSSPGIEDALMFPKIYRLLFPGKYCQERRSECQLECFEKEWGFEEVAFM